MRTFSILPTPRSLSLALALTLGAIILLAACTGSADSPLDAGSTPSAEETQAPATKDDEEATPTPPRDTYIPKGDAKAYLVQGIDSYEAGQYERAIEAFDESIRIDPNYAWAYSNRGSAYVELGIARFDTGQFKQAIKDYDEAIHINPNEVDYYFNRGNAYYGVQQYGRALEDFDEAIRLDPNNSNYYYYRETTLDEIIGRPH